MSGISDDLATLHAHCDPVPFCDAALVRVEAELARLAEENEVFSGRISALNRDRSDEYEARRAAEAEVERLTEALRGIAGQEPDEDDVQDADPEFVLTHPRVFSGAQVARAVLAGRKDTPQ